MKQQLEARLQQLRADYESGLKIKAELDSKQTELQANLLRINGAIQVLEEELQKCTDQLKVVEKQSA